MRRLRNKAQCSFSGSLRLPVYVEFLPLWWPNVPEYAVLLKLKDVAVAVQVAFKKIAKSPDESWETTRIATSSI